MKTFAISNQKGGCGKTTTSVNLAAAFASMGKRTLLIDMDAQAHATLGLGLVPDNYDLSIYELLVRDDVAALDTIQRTYLSHLDIIPSNILLSGAEIDICDKKSREFVLSSKLDEIRRFYDLCVIDCSPSLSVLTLNGLVASDYVIVPVQTHYYAIEGLKQLMDTIDQVQLRFNPALKILGILLTFYDRRTVLSRDVMMQMRDYFGSLVFNTVIHRTVRLAEAPSAGESVLTYAPQSSGALEYMNLAQEIENEEIRNEQKNIVNI